MAVVTPTNQQPVAAQQNAQPATQSAAQSSPIARRIASAALAVIAVLAIALTIAYFPAIPAITFAIIVGAISLSLIALILNSNTLHISNHRSRDYVVVHHEPVTPFHWSWRLPVHRREPTVPGHITVGGGHQRGRVVPPMRPAIPGHVAVGGGHHRGRVIPGERR